MVPGAFELRRLKQAQAFLWKVRFGLHIRPAARKIDCCSITRSSWRAARVRAATTPGGRAADAALLPHVADVTPERAAVAAVPQAILSRTPPKPLTPQFQVRAGSLEAVSEDLFSRHPSALLELFVLLQQHPEIRGVRAGTMRAVTRNLWLIDEEFRQNPRNHRLFLEILRAPRGVTHELRRMNNYGVLGRYIPAFGRVVGRMQYDLFHAYTVDAHTLFVVSNARRLAIPEFNHELPLVSPVMQTLPKQEIVYLGALFHDIAKGRGGDHSDLGAVDAEAFSLEQACPLRRTTGGLGSSKTICCCPLPRRSRTSVILRSSRNSRARSEMKRTRLPVRAHLCRRPRHESKIVEFLEGLTVP